MFKTFITTLALCTTLSAFAAVERMWTPAITTAKPFKGTVTNYDGANVTLEVTQTITFHKSRLSRLDQEWLRANAAKLKCGATSKTCGTTTTTCPGAGTCDPTTGNCDPTTGDSETEDDNAEETTCDPATGECPPATEAKKASTVAAQFAGLTSELKGNAFVKKNVKQNAKFYLLLYSASRCPSCVMFMPKAIAEHKKIQEDPDYEIIHISDDLSESQALIWAISLTNPILVLLPGERLPAVCNLTGSVGIPHLRIVTAEGKLVTQGHASELLPTYNKTCTDYANKNK